MKKIILALALLVTAFVQANNFATYTQHIATDRLLLIFNSNVTAEQQAEVIKQSGVVTSSAFISGLNVTVCLVDNYTAAQQYFAGRNEIKFVSFFIQQGKHYAGVTNSFFVKLSDANFAPQLQTKIKALGITDMVADKYIPNLYLLTLGGKTQNAISICEQFSNEAWCAYASPNYLLNPLVTSNDTYFNRQWPLQNTGTALQGNGTTDADMDVDSAWTITTGTSVKVAILDSGVDTLHADLQENLLPGHDALDDGTDGYPTPNFDNDGHGTCCAGIVAAVKDNGIGVAGVAPSAKIIPVRTFKYVMLGSDVIPFATANAFAQAIGWAWNDAGCDIQSHSWGLPPSLIVALPGGVVPVEDAIATAYASGRGGLGCAMFFSSGNEGDSIGPIWPGKLQKTIAVNATSMCDERKNVNDCSPENWGGDFGPGLDFGAPGVRVPTTDMLGNNGFVNGEYYLSFNGTSAACPNAAAIGALVLSVRSDLTVEGVRSVIAQTCDKVGGYNYDSTAANGTWCPELGYGRVNAYRAVQFANIYNSVNDVHAKLNWKLLPNPAKDVLTVLTTENNGMVNMYNLAGQEVLHTNVEGSYTTINISQLQSGIYVVQLRTATGTATAKVTVAK